MGAAERACRRGAYREGLGRDATEIPTEIPTASLADHGRLRAARQRCAARPGLGFGGGCLPKDIRAFLARADELGAGQALGFLREVDSINLRRRDRVVELARELCEGSLSGRRIAVWGAAFKPDSDDIRDSPALDIADRLQRLGADVCVYDPKAMDNARKLFPTLTYSDSVVDAAKSADVVLHLAQSEEAVVATMTGGVAARPPESGLSVDEAMEGRDVYRRYGGGNPQRLEEAMIELETVPGHAPPVARATSSGQAALLLAATLVAPGHDKVVPLEPAFIVPQDGAEKQDCENRAAKRWLATHGQRYAALDPNAQVPSHPISRPPTAQPK